MSFFSCLLLLFVPWSASFVLFNLCFCRNERFSFNCFHLSLVCHLVFLQHRAFPCLVLFFVVPLSVLFVIRFFVFRRMFLIRCLLEVMLATLAKTNLAGPRSSKINSSWFGSALPLMDHALPWFLMLFPMATAALGIISWPEVVLGNRVQWCWCLRVVPITALLVWRLYSRRLLRATSASLAAAPVGPKLFCEAGSNGRAFPFSVFVCLLFT